MMVFNPAFILPERCVIQDLCSKEWFIFYANLPDPKTNKEPGDHRYLAIPISKENVILFLITSQVKKVIGRYKKYNKNEQIKRVFMFKKEEWPEGTFTEESSIADLNEPPVILTIEQCSKLAVHLKNHFAPARKNTILNILQENEKLEDNTRGELTTLYCEQDQ